MASNVVALAYTLGGSTPCTLYATDPHGDAVVIELDEKSAARLMASLGKFVEIRQAL